MRAHFAPHARDGRFFGSVLVSGAHAESLEQLCRGEVDVAAIDCVTYALLARCRPRVTEPTRIIGRTAVAPGLPYATSIGMRERARSAGAQNTQEQLVARLRAGLFRAFADPELAPLRDALLIDGLDVLPASAYACMAELEADALQRRYVELDE